MKEYLRTMLDHDSFARHCGFVVNSAGAGTAAVTVVLGPQHMNGMNSAHGGLIFSLADFAFAAACNSHQMMAVGID
ncbi:MAG TPA: hotdog fold thioesterase, partial [bacterium]|nr:hotdog fold thioesterase [bacterium]